MRTIKRICILFLTLALSFTSCEQQQVEEPCILSDYESAIIEASFWIDSNFLPEINFGPNDHKGPKLEIMPDWDNIIFNSFDDYTTIELNLKVKGHFSFVPKDCREAYNNSADRRYLQTLTRLIIKVDRRSGETTGFFMTQIPSSEYRNENDFRCFNSTYLNMQEEYDGYILYHKINGDFANGWKYSNGNIIKSVQSNHRIDISTKSEMVCEYYILEVMYEQCKVYIQLTPDEIIQAWETCSTYTQDEQIFEVCFYDGVQEGGGGYAPDPDPDDGAAPPEITYTQEFLDSEAECVNTKLKDGNIINQLLSSFNLTDSNIDINFKLDDLNDNAKIKLIDRVNGRYKFEIALDRGRLYDASIEIARTLLHECFHAYIFGKLYDDVPHDGLFPEPNFDSDFADYESEFGPDAQHNYMANHYIESMKTALRDYYHHPDHIGDVEAIFNYTEDHPYWYGEDFLFECLAWGGLKNTAAWDDFQADEEKYEKYSNTRDYIFDLLPKEKCKSNEDEDVIPF